MQLHRTAPWRSVEATSGQPAWVHDARIKAAIVAAPAVSYLFGSGGLNESKFQFCSGAPKKTAKRPIFGIVLSFAANFQLLRRSELFRALTTSFSLRHAARRSRKLFPLFVRTRPVWTVWHSTKSSIAPWLLIFERRCNEAVLEAAPRAVLLLVDRETGMIPEITGKSSLTISAKPVRDGAAVSGVDSKGRTIWIVAA